MEKRALLAAALTVGLLLLYQLLYPPVPLSPPKEPRVERKVPPAPEHSIPPLPVPKRARPVPGPPGIAEVETPLYRGRVGGDGGRVLEWVLRYRGDKPLVVAGVLGSRGLGLSHLPASPEPFAFEIKPDRLVLGADKPQGELALAGEDEFGMRVAETLRFDARDYLVGVHVKLENRHSVPQAVEVLIPWFTLGKWPEGDAEKFKGQQPTRIVRLTSNGLQRMELGAVTDDTAEGEWIGLESEWYIAALLSRSPGFRLVTVKGPGDRVEVALKAGPLSLAPGRTWEGRAAIYVGPKEYDRLKAVGVGLEKAINYGNFLWMPFFPMEWLAVPILWLMNFFHAYIPNYGVAIILLTVITKILFFPLTLKGMASMKAMQALQPQINALRSKYQKDPQRLQRETMELYRAHKVNPMGGCLPMLVQVPIFYSLYLVFSLSVELQNAAFLCFGTIFGRELWVCDLAQHDPTYVLPILMGVSMFVQQKMTPTVGDPTQAKIMLLMPVVFTFMFLNLPSGLVLYWFVSNVLQILQQSYQNYADRAAKRSWGTAKKESGGGARS